MAKISLEVHRVDNWMQVNNLSLNLNKPNLIFYLRIANQPNAKPFNVIEINYFYIKVINMARYLKGIFDDKLSFQSRLDQLKAKLSGAVGILCKFKPFLNTSCLLKLYYPNFLYHLEYGILL